MPTPAKPRRRLRAPKKPKNQPITFHEAIAAAPAPVLSPTASLNLRSNVRLQRLALTLAWAGAMVLFGAAIGWRILASQSVALTVPGMPIAVAEVSVRPGAGYHGPIAAPTVPKPPSLAVAPATAPSQANVGSPFVTLATRSFQSAAAPDALVPGYQTEVFAQGNIGTAAVH